MRPNSVDVERTHPASKPQHGLWETLVATGVLATVIAVGLVAASAPGVAAAIVGASLVGYAIGRAALRSRGGRGRVICIPRTDVCIGA